ncbi:hypothetical protein [Phytohabitans aurantiacus]|jgi:hypothetical protein|uniref:Uncharacterized protein n=1 Tax=Phytohabitans aurantiacus TaxID=3016789 RepID=A0ABQ5R975_9ACTN|nr:hypothetical protein [Phytohabitans aurantiacus]GLI02938.1 hypothetical protein Pa4123_82160 [Phytohabitans aurantiacus]
MAFVLLGLLPWAATELSPNSGMPAAAGYRRRSIRLSAHTIPLGERAAARRLRLLGCYGTIAQHEFDTVMLDLVKADDLDGYD